MTALPCRIGLDFDNTLIRYDAVFLRAARERGLVGPDCAGRKQAVRDQIRRLPSGEIHWQKLQGYVYGKGIAAATMFEGVDRFLRRCAQEGAAIVIVSHKTEYGHDDSDRVNLRDAAHAWMQARGFFSARGFGISADSVFFEGTRADKLTRIGALGCTHFVDDLEEVIADPRFPRSVTPILFSADGGHSPALRCKVCSSWREIEEQVFDAAA